MKNATLTPQQCKDLLGAIRAAGKKHALDFALCVSLLHCGKDARVWTWGKALRAVVQMPAEVYTALRELAFARGLGITLSPTDYEKHWQSGIWERAIFSAAGSLTPFTTQEITRRVKRWARRAGIGFNVNMQTLVNTHKTLRGQFGNADLANGSFLLSSPLAPVLAQEARQRGKPKRKSVIARATRDPRLHGIHRRPARAG